MLKKKVIATASAFTLMLSISTMTVLAGTGHHSRSVSYPVCPVEGCEIAETHQHDQDTYCGHSLNDGHDYHQSCRQTDCTNSDAHEHDGHYYFGCSDSNRDGMGHHGQHHSNGHH